MRALLIAVLLLACGGYSMPAPRGGFSEHVRLHPYDSRIDLRCGDRPLAPPPEMCGPPWDRYPAEWFCTEVAGSGPVERQWNWRWMPGC